jgi:hypothetical protein
LPPDRHPGRYEHLGPPAPKSETIPVRDQSAALPDLDREHRGRPVDPGPDNRVEFDQSRLQELRGAAGKGGDYGRSGI